MRKTSLFAALAALGLSAVAMAAEIISYRYDARGRLVRVERSGNVNNGVATNYSYDKADNRKIKTVSGAP